MNRGVRVPPPPSAIDFMQPMSPLRFTFVRTFTAIAVLGSFAASARLFAETPAPTKAPASNYLEVVKRAADVLLEKGVDRYGPQHSGIILSVLNRQTGEPLELLPKAASGLRKADRTVAGGSNANLQIDLYRALQHLSRLTGEARYDKAARAGLVDFLRLTQHPETGLLAWGEHLSWNCFTEQAASLIPDALVHEQKRKFIYFDQLYEAEPERTLKYARGLWEHQIGDQKTGDFSRHTAYDKHDPRKGWDFPKEGSYFIDTWSRAYAKTKDPVYANAVQVLAKRYLDRTNERGLLDFDTQKDPERDNMCVSLWLISLALECHDAIPRMNGPAVEILRKLMESQDRGFLGLKHAADDPEKGFICYAFTDSGEPRPREGKSPGGYSRCWSMGYGVNLTSMYGLLAYSRQAQLGSAPGGDEYRAVVVAAAKAYQKAVRKPKEDDLWAGEYGMAIFVELAAFRITKDEAFLKSARELGDEAVNIFWEGGSALPRTSSRKDYYDATTYPDTLLMSLLALHEHVSGLPAAVEISDTIR
jgi:hypothetical protein